MIGEKKYLLVEQHLRNGMNNGVYLPDDKLPSIRQLSIDLHVSKNTVIRAYQELEALGLIYAVAKSGYRVKWPVHQGQYQHVQEPKEVDLLTLSRSLLTYPNYKEILPTGSAHPNTDFPAIKSLYAEIARQSRTQSNVSSHYQLPPGDGKLIRQLLKISLDLGVPAQSESISVTHGAQQAISLALRALTQPGDIVAVESPCYFGSLLLMEALGLKVLEIPSCVRTGIDPLAFEEASRLWDIKALLITPNFTNPTGARLPLNKRKTLLQVSGDIPIIEDDVFGSLCTEKAIPSLFSLDDKGRVIYVNSLSKTLDSRLRIGWLISGRYHTQIDKYLLCENMGGSNLMQSAVADFLTTGKYKIHLNKIRRVYQQNQRRFNLMLSQELNLHDNLVGRYHITQPEGSFLVWLTLPKGFDSYKVCQLCREQGISILPGSMFGTAHQFDHCLRFSTANFSEQVNWSKGLNGLVNIISNQLENQ
ncbi:PLP-dependent aminotransferase family protein [Vibrio tapetis subsp. quintayensis]|uniref:aminotransferase-like domain-containing protein n=1 Tax=Vibrio tapetis TaxID=52443 RepID=UPI0025B3EAC3|nr:PLP-dependent aminotransferase family protein [Vibrio tapetis]MDN3682213.1 PLP-dependent aminotransferase family protein [Vibrio tapetis subsp. quintayensis]